MKLSDYQKQALLTDRTPAVGGASTDVARLIPLLGLAGEAGQLVAEYKKRLRDGPGHVLLLIVSPRNLATSSGIWQTLQANTVLALTMSLNRTSTRLHRYTSIMMHLCGSMLNTAKLNAFLASLWRPFASSESPHG